MSRNKTYTHTYITYIHTYILTYINEQEQALSAGTPKTKQNAVLPSLGAKQLLPLL